MNEIVERLNQRIAGRKAWVAHKQLILSRPEDAELHDHAKGFIADYERENAFDAEVIAALQCNAEPVALRYRLTGEWRYTDKAESMAAAMAELSAPDYELLYTSPQAAQAIPEGWPGELLLAPLDPTIGMIEDGAQSLVHWDGDCKWPDSWSALQVSAARNDAEKVWRSMWLKWRESNPLGLAASQDKGGERG